jgi:NodT family efflux transporter outer membrane factor (OMF) lipoprotein
MDKRVNVRVKWKLPLAPLGLVFLAGCHFNQAPQYTTPVAPTPQAYKEAPAQFKEGSGWKIAQPGDDKIRPKWWEMYNDPVLSALEEQVQISNQTIAQAEANYRAAQAVVLSARASLYPTIGASTSYTNARSSATSHGSIVSSATTTSSGTTGTGTTSTGTTGTGTTGTGSTGTSATGVGTVSSSPVNEYSLTPFSFSYTVDLWHRIRNQVAADAYAAQASAADIQTALLSVQTTLAQDYFELRETDAQRMILQDTLKNYQDALKLTGILFKTGIDSEQDVTQAQVQFDTTNAQLTDFGVARAQYEHAIAVLIGKPASSFEIAYGAFVPTPPPIPVAVPSTLLERRPDIAALERTIASDNALIGVARAAYYPNLTLSASAGLQTTSFTQWFTWPSRFWSLGPSFAETLFDGGARKAAVYQAEANYDAAVANYRETVLTSFQAVEDELAALRILSEEAVQNGTAVKSSQHYLDLANIRYKTGVDSYLNVITAQNTLLTNRETEVQVQLRRMTASVQLILALGGGWDKSELPQNVLPVGPRNKPLPTGGDAPSPASPNYNPAPVPKATPAS